ncbi:MAG: RNA polymerase sigma factor [Ignavibacteriales bacterium]
MDERKLINDARAGDKSAFEELIKRYYFPLQKFFINHDLNLSTAQDLTHDTIIKIIENIENFIPFRESSFSCWVFRIAYNNMMNYFSNHSNKMMPEDIEEYQEIKSPLKSVEEEIIENENHYLINEGLNLLTKEDKTIIVLHYINELSYKEIGEILSINEKKVKWKLHNALERLRKLMKKEALINEM